MTNAIIAVARRAIATIRRDREADANNGRYFSDVSRCDDLLHLDGLGCINVKEVKTDNSPSRRAARAAGLFVGYVGAPKRGLAFATVQPNATAIWPPTGIAIAACVLLGRDAWPAIFAGAFLVNITTAGSVATSLGIAVGNTLEGVLGAYLVERYAHGRLAFTRAPDVFRFAALAGLLTPAVSATIGVSSLSLG